MLILKIWLISISVVAVIMTFCDKIFAKRDMWRISENALMVVSALGGSFFMYITMLVIRHKTRHIKFMLGLPLVMVIQCIFAWFILYALKMSGQDISEVIPEIFSIFIY